jgi:hypothetical protein
MKSYVYIPSSLRVAGKHLRVALAQPLSALPKREFLRAWCSVAYLYPGLHPDGYRLKDSGWPRILKRFAAEAWRRARAGQLADEELYCSDAAWAGLHDRMTVHYPDETERRLELSDAYGQPEHA